MTPAAERPVGLTRDTGWQIGVRRTLAVDARTAWDWLLSDAGLALWLGDTPEIDFNPGATYAFANGVTGELRVFKPYSHLRITWQPPGWPRPSTIQLRVIPQGDRAVVAFHQEHLPDQAAREQQREWFAGVIGKLEAALG